jgi:hypothetical protein
VPVQNLWHNAGASCPQVGEPAKRKLRHIQHVDANVVLRPPQPRARKRTHPRRGSRGCGARVWGINQRAPAKASPLVQGQLADLAGERRPQWLCWTESKSQTQGHLPKDMSGESRKSVRSSAANDTQSSDASEAPGSAIRAAISPALARTATSMACAVSGFCFRKFLALSRP